MYEEIKRRSNSLRNDFIPLTDDYIFVSFDRIITLDDKQCVTFEKNYDIDKVQHHFSTVYFETI